LILLLIWVFAGESFIPEGKADDFDVDIKSIYTRLDAAKCWGT